MSLQERIEKARARLDAYYDAELKVLEGQEYQIGKRSLTRADLGEIRKAIKELESLITSLEARAAGRGKRKAFSIIPRDL